jgi:hypothetical protein
MSAWVRGGGRRSRRSSQSRNAQPIASPSDVQGTDGVMDTNHVPQRKYVTIQSNI